jgi:AcrR family transcriptional regulator
MPRTLEGLSIFLNSSFCYAGHVERGHTKGAQTRRAILEAAIARFGREGYRQTSVADIARDASVGSTVAYAYFPNKEALFLAAVDEDAAAVIQSALTAVMAEPDVHRWTQTGLVAVLGTLDDHPLARRLLAGLEPEVTARTLELPALAELRKVCTERLRTDQLDGLARPDIDPVTIGNGLVTIFLSLLMSVVQLGEAAMETFGDDVATVLQAATERTGPPRTTTTFTPPRSRSTTD